ncbi:proteasome subunit beta type-6 isoform X3 [Vanacampus margaritifer]
MERHQRRLEECFLAKVSVAVAMSVIRSRPEGASVSQHVEALAARLKERDQTWRSKAEELQREVLGLRQALLVATATASAGHNVTTESECAPGSDSDTPELFQLVPPPPPLPFNQQRDAQQRAGLPHEHILHSLCALQRADPPPLGPGRDGDISEDALCELLDGLVATFRHRWLGVGTSQLALKACQASSRATDMFSLRSMPPARLTSCLKASLRELTAMLLHARRRQPTVDLLAECLVALGRSRMAKSFLVGHILSEENASVDEVPVDEYHNALRLLSILEELLSDSPLSWRQEVKSEQMASLRRLQQQMFALWHEFPLFAVTVWRVAMLAASSNLSSSATDHS